MDRTELYERLGVVLMALGQIPMAPDAPQESQNATQTRAAVSWEYYDHERILRWQGTRRRPTGERVPLFNTGLFVKPESENPLNIHMFKPPGGGLVGLPQITTRKFVHLPSGKAGIRAYLDSRGNRHHVYQIGTRFREEVYWRGSLFEVRSSEKIAAGHWEFDAKTVGTEPPGYSQPESCTDCHRHAGKAADSIHRIKWVGEPGRTWAGYSTAPGDDFVLSFDPVQYGVDK